MTPGSITMAGMLVAVGAPVRQVVTYLGALTHLGVSGFLRLAIPPHNLQAIVQHMDRIGVQSVPIALLTALFVGMVFALETAYGLQKFGADAMLGVGVALAIVRELGPVMTAIMVVLPLLTILADVVGIVGGMLIAGAELRMSHRRFLAVVLQTLTVGDVTSGLVKALGFGGIIATVACYQGLQTTGGTEGVGRATTATVVISALLILASDFFLSKFFLVVFPPRVSL